LGIRDTLFRTIHLPLEPPAQQSSEEQLKLLISFSLGTLEEVAKESARRRGDTLTVEILHP
jgi:hypothetical protein